VTAAPAAPAVAAARPIRWPMRVVFLVGVAFVIGAGVQLYVLARHTDRVFAWTIASPLTAASIGAFYLMAAVVSGLSVRRSWWHLARVGIPPILVFLWLTLLASLLHLSVFHLHEGPLLARLAAWAWLAIYVIDPPFATAAYVVQVLTPGGDPVRPRPLPAWLPSLLVLLAVPWLAAGLWLFLVPAAGHHWAWAMAPLAAQALGAWCVSLGLALVTMAVEADWERVLPMSVGVAVLAVLELGALVRFRHEVHGLSGWLWIALVAAVGVLGGAGTAAVRRPVT
jgi:hypothetical protein